MFAAVILFPAAASAKTYPAKVVRVVDGDTIEVSFSGEKHMVRLIGMDTPESVYNKRTKKQAKESDMSQKEIVALGKAAKRFVQSRVKTGDIIRIEYGTLSKDKYGRLLCYVFLENGAMLNKVIIKNGYAVPLTIPPNVKYKNEFLAAYRYARKNSKGLWE